MARIEITVPGERIVEEFTALVSQPTTPTGAKPVRVGLVEISQKNEFGRIGPPGPPSGAIVSDTPPSEPLFQGQLWWNSTNGNLYAWYIDEDSRQFVQVVDSGVLPSGYTGTDAIPTVGGYFIDEEPTTQLHRFRDRAFFGDGVKYTGNRFAPYGGGWLMNHASYFEKNSQVTVLGEETEERYGLLAASLGPSAIALGAVAVSEDGLGGRAVYTEAFHKSAGTILVTSLSNTNPALCTVSDEDIVKCTNGQWMLIAGAQGTGLVNANGIRQITSVGSPANTFTLVGVNASAGSVPQNTPPLTVSATPAYVITNLSSTPLQCVCTVGSAADIAKFENRKTVFITGATGTGTVNANGSQTIKSVDVPTRTFILDVDTDGGVAQTSGVFATVSARSTTSMELTVGNYTPQNIKPNSYYVDGTRGMSININPGIGYTLGDSNAPTPLTFNPPAAAIDITGSATNPLGVDHWRVGIVFRNGSLWRGTTGQAGEAIALSMAKDHALVWDVSRTVRGAVIRSDVSSTTGLQDVGLIFQNTQAIVTGCNERPITLFKDDVNVGGAVNFWHMGNSRTLLPLYLKAEGTDADVPITFGTKGTGRIGFLSQDGAVENFRVISGAGTAINHDYVTVQGGIAAAGLGIDGTSTNAALGISPKGTGSLLVRDGVGTTKIQINTTGVAFWGATPAARPALPAAASDPATTMALVNAIRTALINYGLTT